MKLKRLSTNATLLVLEDGTEVLFSYETPVAAYVPGEGYRRTEQFYSRGTTKHINEWLGNRTSVEVEQAVLDWIIRSK